MPSSSNSSSARLCCCAASMRCDAAETEPVPCQAMPCPARPGPVLHCRLGGQAIEPSNRPPACKAPLSTNNHAPPLPSPPPLPSSPPIDDTFSRAPPNDTKACSQPASARPRPPQAPQHTPRCRVCAAWRILPPVWLGPPVRRVGVAHGVRPGAAAVISRSQPAASQRLSLPSSEARLKVRRRRRPDASSPHAAPLDHVLPRGRCVRTGAEKGDVNR